MIKSLLQHFGKLLGLSIGMFLIFHAFFFILYLGLNASDFIASIYSNLLFIATLSLPIVIIGICLSLLNEKIGYWALIILFQLFLIIHYTLLNYLHTTGILLGADLFGYTIPELLEIISTSSEIKILPALILVGMVALSIWLSFKSITNATSRYWTIALLIIPIGLILPKIKSSNYTEAQYSRISSPSSYFWLKTYEYLVRDNSNHSINPYPFLQKRNISNPLQGLLIPKNDLPDIIIIAVEGLGADFVGNEARYGGATPFLDSLINYSLYWPNCLSNTGRTFGVLPTLTGSLPYGEKGFMDYGPNYPAHNSLWKWLKMNGYSTNYFYGGNPNFDNQDVFLEAQQIDRLFGESSFDPKIDKMPGNSEGFSWGYGDHDLFDLTYSKLPTLDKPSFSFIMTLSTHEPFIPPSDRFRNQIELLASNKSSSIYNEYQSVFECLAYTDNSLRSFINQISQLENFDNSIIIITGDHRLIPIPTEKRLDRFHVPLIIYSPRIKQPKKMEALISHSQVTPTLMNWLAEAYHLKINDYVSFISPPVDTSSQFISNLDLALMRSKNETEEYIFGSNVLSNGELYTISSGFELALNSNGTQKKLIQQKLTDFVSISHYALTNNQLVPDSLAKSTGIVFTDGELDILNKSGITEMVPDSIYSKARALAMQRQFQQSRLICRFGLTKSPNFHDLRVLLARTYAWEDNYDETIKILDEVLRRSENYEDAYIAYSDVAYWNQKSEIAKEMAELGLVKNPNSLELEIRVARSYMEQGDRDQAKPIIDRVLNKQPNNELAKQLDQRLKNNLEQNQ